MTPEQIKDKYEARIMVILNKMSNALKEAGFVCDEPSFMGGDEYDWSFCIHVDEDPQELAEEDIDVSFRIAESETYDGSTGGVNFMLSFVEVGGRIVGECIPENYTDKVWVPRGSEKGVEKRFRCMEAIESEGAVYLVKEHVDQVKS